MRIDIKAVQMEAVCEDLSTVSARLRYAEAELEEIRMQLQRQEPMEELVDRLKGEEEGLQKTWGRNQRLTAALESITAAYSRTETQVSEVLEGGTRYYKQFEPGTVNLKNVAAQLEELLQSGSGTDDK